MIDKLTWLPKPPSNFSQLLKDVSSCNELRELAKFSFDENHLIRLSRKLKSFQDQKANLFPLTAMKIGLISNANTKLTVTALVGTALRYGIALEVEEAEYNQISQVAFSLNSVFKDQNLSLVLVAIDYRGLPFIQSPGDERSAEGNVQYCIAYIKSLVESLRTKTGAQIIIQNIVNPVETIFGSSESYLQGTLSWLISNFNSNLKIMDLNNAIILDVSSLASKVGLQNWHDQGLWNLAKLSFSQKYMPIYAEYVCRILSAFLGKSRRCLILDLDNTIWGGVIGDDGIEGILIGNGDPTGEAFLQLQKTILEIRSRGIVLAVSSKNDDSTARLPFKDHPDMILRENHIAVFQANWADKASNIKAIAEKLSLGLDSMVFLDDNPAERMQVRNELPEVAVPELPDDPALFSTILTNAGYFESITFSEEDRNRAAFYQNNEKRLQYLNQSSNLEAHLKALDMTIKFVSFDLIGRSRIAQLINKSNQFNLTTKRYSELEIEKIEKDQNIFTRQIRLKDIFGDQGMISVIICKKNKDFWEIDTWLMSCRVLGRKVELAVLYDIVTNARESGASKLVGIYIPSARNAMVKKHYEKLGFKRSSNNSEVESWELDIINYSFEQIPITVTLNL